ncbi:hypothetical protein HK104_002927 [Borealophlyctis nickersoniae]|nr:hypothetical protein HK104_002927 [Borealophlyctis nickersoniae]
MIPTYVVTAIGGRLAGRNKGLIVIAIAVARAEALEALARNYLNTCQTFAVCSTAMAVWALWHGFVPETAKNSQLYQKIGRSKQKKDGKKDRKKPVSVQQPACGVSRSLQIQLLFMVLIALGATSWTQFGGVPQCAKGNYPQTSESSFQILARADSNTGYVSVIEDPTKYEGVRVMRCDHSILGGSFLRYNMDSIFGSFYFLDFVRYIKRPSEHVGKPRALQIGLGIGVTAKTLTEASVLVDVVELDPVLVQYAHDFFDLPPVNIEHIGDGRVFLDKIGEEKGYDYVLHDVFTGGVVPESLFSVEAMQGVKRVLKDDGILALNFVGTRNGTAIGVIARTLKEVFPYISLYIEEPPPEMAQDKNIVCNQVFFAADFPLSFQPTSNDLRAGGMYGHMLKRFASFKADAVPGIGVEGDIITDKRNPLAGMMVASALEHWKLMREMFQVEVWEKF